jgi:hypothetical protein
MVSLDFFLNPEGVAYSAPGILQNNSMPEMFQNEMFEDENL